MKLIPPYTGCVEYKYLLSIKVEETLVNQTAIWKTNWICKNARVGDSLTLNSWAVDRLNCNDFMTQTLEKLSFVITVVAEKKIILYGVEVGTFIGSDVESNDLFIFTSLKIFRSHCTTRIRVLSPPTNSIFKQSWGSININTNNVS